MIDAETLIYAEVYERVIAQFPKVFMTGEYVKSPSDFPCVSLVEIDNAVYRNSSTNCVEENHAAVSYELNVYSNKKTGKKSECRKIAAFVDEQMAYLGFTRMMLEPVPNLEDATIYRMLGRYRAVIGKDGTIYRR